MNRNSRVLAVLMGLCLLAGAAAAQQETKPPDFWSALRARIEKLVPAKPPAETTAVGGVRGARGGAEGLYWKGEERPAVAVSEPEVQAFALALGLVATGTREQALAGFEQFLVSYPASGMRKDAELAIEELKAGR